MAVASEVPEGRKFNEARLKDLASKDILTTRPLYAEAIQFVPSHTLYGFMEITSLECPGSDSGIQRRMSLLPFDQVIPDPAKVDRFFEKKLEEELGGILNWSIGRMYVVAKARQHGASARNGYRSPRTAYLTDMDVILQFIEDANSPYVLAKRSTSWCLVLGLQRLGGGAG